MEFINDIQSENCYCNDDKICNEHTIIVNIETGKKIKVMKKKSNDSIFNIEKYRYKPKEEKIIYNDINKSFMEYKYNIPIMVPNNIYLGIYPFNINLIEYLHIYEFP